MVSYLRVVKPEVKNQTNYNLEQRKYFVVARYDITDANTHTHPPFEHYSKYNSLSVLINYYIPTVETDPFLLWHSFHSLNLITIVCLDRAAGPKQDVVQNLSQKPIHFIIREIHLFQTCVFIQSHAHLLLTSWWMMTKTSSVSSNPTTEKPSDFRLFQNFTCRTSNPNFVEIYWLWFAKPIWSVFELGPWTPTFSVRIGPIEQEVCRPGLAQWVRNPFGPTHLSPARPTATAFSSSLPPTSRPRPLPESQTPNRKSSEGIGVGGDGVRQV